MDSVASIPRVDLSHFVKGGDPATKVAAARSFSEACRLHGCVGIDGHGISETRLNEAFGLIKRFFKLPHEQKMKAPHPESGVPARGYAAPGMEKVYSKETADKEDVRHIRERREVVDLKETYDIGNPKHKVHTNIWLPDEILPGFRSFMTDLFWELHEASLVILDALLLGHGLPEVEVEKVKALVASGYSSALRLAHYLPVDTTELAKGELGRMATHTDWVLFTLLFQDSSGGLEFQNSKIGEFMPAISQDGLIYMNVGEMLTMLSNGIYPAASHRVTAPIEIKRAEGEALDVVPGRYSMPFFFWPHEDMVVAPLGSCISSENPARYKPVKVADYVASRNKYLFTVDGNESR